MFRKSHGGRTVGMLFDFGTPQAVTFWMKNTLIPLDLVFIGKDGRVVSPSLATPRRCPRR